MRAVCAAFIVALFTVTGLPAAPVDELFGVWVLERSGDAANADETPGAGGDLAIWRTDAGIGLTWNQLPPDPVRRTFEFARDPAGGRLEVVRSDPPRAPGERVEARLEPDRLVVIISHGNGGAGKNARYVLLVQNGRLVFDYRLRQDTVTLESSTRRLRRLKVVM